MTNFGKLLDPIADKILTTSALLAFMTMGLCNIWIVMIVLAREFAVASVRMIAAADGVVIPANKWGKAKTVSQMTFTIIIMLLCEADYIAVTSFSKELCGGKYLVHIAAYFKFTAVDNRRSDSSFGCCLLKGQ